MSTKIKFKKDFILGDDFTVRRMGYGAMRITGQGIWGPPKDRAGAINILSSTFLSAHRKELVSNGEKSRLPVIYPNTSFVEDGGLMSYGPNTADNYRRAATYVDKILKGAKPADLPIEQPMKFEFVINLKRAKQISLTIPPNVLARADRVIR